MPRSPSATKTKILEATRTLFSSHGFENTTIDDIITATGITKGAFYHYFKSKEALCQTVIGQALADYQSLAEEIPADVSPLDKLGMFIEKIGQLNASGAWVNCRLMIRLLSEPHDEAPNIQLELANFWQWMRGFYFDMITRCRDARQIKTDLDADAQTTLLIAMLFGIITLNQIDQSSSTLTDLATPIINTLK